ncbi:MAG: hypothetical protein EOO77_12125, partial [Oxalobacteraceae bacterium]
MRDTHSSIVAGLLPLCADAHAIPSATVSVAAPPRRSAIAASIVLERVTLSLGLSPVDWCAPSVRRERAGSADSQPSVDGTAPAGPARKRVPAVWLQGFHPRTTLGEAVLPLLHVRVGALHVHAEVEPSSITLGCTLQDLLVLDVLRMHTVCTSAPLQIMSTPADVTPQMQEQPVPRRRASGHAFESGLEHDQALCHMLVFKGAVDGQPHALSLHVRLLNAPPASRMSAPVDVKLHLGDLAACVNRDSVQQLLAFASVQVEDDVLTRSMLSSVERSIAQYERRLRLMAAVQPASGSAGTTSPAASAGAGNTAVAASVPAPTAAPSAAQTEAAAREEALAEQPQLAPAAKAVAAAAPKSVPAAVASVTFAMNSVTLVLNTEPVRLRSIVSPAIPARGTDGGVAKQEPHQQMASATTGAGSTLS